jgi:hypothetical protein
MGRPKRIRDPVKLKIEIDRTLHRQLIERCGEQTVKEGRVKPLAELVREILGDAVAGKDKKSCTR